MTEKTCNTCQWFVAEMDGKPGDYQHAEAVKEQKGFCLVQDLFTDVKPKDEACEDYADDFEK